MKIETWGRPLRYQLGDTYHRATAPFGIVDLRSRCNRNIKISNAGLRTTKPLDTRVCERCVILVGMDAAKTTGSTS
jgi:hypothetical protein